MRDERIDAGRGLAVVLMALDHYAWVWLPDQWGTVRLLTGWAMPLFMVVSGMCMRPGWRWRYLDVLCAALLSLVPIAVMGAADVPILAVYVLLVPLLVHVRDYPVFLLVLGVAQSQLYPFGWSGYEPGAVLAWVSLGVLAREWIVAGVPGSLRVSWGFPSSLVLVGRYPLSLYVGHLYLLVFPLLWVQYL